MAAQCEVTKEVVIHKEELVEFLDEKGLGLNQVLVIPLQMEPDDVGTLTVLTYTVIYREVITQGSDIITPA